MQRTPNQDKSSKPKVLELAVGLLVVAFVPYALFGKNKKFAGWLAFINGMEISLALVFLEPLLLLPNPFLALYASSSIWTKRNHVARKS